MLLNMNWLVKMEKTQKYGKHLLYIWKHVCPIETFFSLLSNKTSALSLWDLVNPIKNKVDYFQIWFHLNFIFILFWIISYYHLFTVIPYLLRTSLEILKKASVQQTDQQLWIPWHSCIINTKSTSEMFGKSNDLTMT